MFSACHFHLSTFNLRVVSDIVFDRHAVPPPENIQDYALRSAEGVNAFLIQRFLENPVTLRFDLRDQEASVLSPYNHSYKAVNILPHRTVSANMELSEKNSL